MRDNSKQRLGESIAVHPGMPLPVKAMVGYNIVGNGGVLVGSLDFKSSSGQGMSVVGSIPMHSRHFFCPK